MPCVPDVTKDDRPHAGRAAGGPRRSPARRGRQGSPAVRAELGQRRRARWDRLGGRSRVRIVAGPGRPARSGPRKWRRARPLLVGSRRRSCDPASACRPNGVSSRPPPPCPPGVRTRAGARRAASGSFLSPRRPPTSRRSDSRPASRSTSSPAISDTPRFLTLDPRGTLLVSVPRAGRVVALPDDNRTAGPTGRAGRRRPRASPRARLPRRPALRRRDGPRRALRLRSGHAARPRRADGRRAGPPGARQPLDADHRHRSRSEAPTSPSDPPATAARSATAAARRSTATTLDGRNGAPFATGLRNAVGIAFRPGTAELWATVNGRDWLGDDRPAEYVTRVEEGGFYGWPYCHWAPAGPVPDPDLGGGRPTARRRGGRASSTRRTLLRSGSPSTPGPSSLRSIAATSSSRSTAPGTARRPSATR